MIDQKKIPHLMKYMGSKREILEFITASIHEYDIHSEWFCDLFSGTSVVGAAMRDEYNVHTNDIQSYSAVFADTYFNNLNRIVTPDEIDIIKGRTDHYVNEFHINYPEFNYNYNSVNDIITFQQLEQQQQGLLDINFNIGFHLFVKYYSGTYWSYDQCVWIDSIRAVAEEYIDMPILRSMILSSLIYAMS